MTRAGPGNTPAPPCHSERSEELSDTRPFSILESSIRLKDNIRGPLTE